MAEPFNAHNITPVQFGVLVAVAEQPGLDLTRLSGLINYDRPTLTGVIDRLESKGLVVREPDPKDRRARCLRITLGGKDVLDRIEKTALLSRDAVLEPLTKAERKLLLQMLERLVEHHPINDNLHIGEQ